MRGPVKVCRGDVERFLSQTLSIGPRACQPSPNPLGDALPLELRQGGENMQLKASRRRLQVDAFAEGHEPHPEGLEVVQERHEVLQAAPQTIQPPDYDGIHFPAPGIRHEPVQGWTAIRAAGDAMIDVFHGLPPASLHIALDLEELVFRCLIECADAAVDPSPHQSTPDSLKL